MGKAFAVLLLLVSGGAVAEDLCEPAPLRILLTNDDGIGSVGIVQMHRALLAAGHRVKRVAPNINYSGSAASITRAITVEDRSTDEFPEVYEVSGSPAAAVIFAATAMRYSERDYDLIVSGINYGPNIGPLITFSGTVGAVLAGMNILSVPGIAISTRSPSDDPDSPEYKKHFANVARFVVRTIDAVQCDAQSLLDSSQALVINYPPRSPKKVRGVVLAQQGDYIEGMRVAYIDEAGEGEYLLRLQPFSSPRDGGLADTRLFEDGYITIVPVDGRFESSPDFDVRQILELEP